MSMPERDIMHLRNKPAAWAVLCMLLVVTSSLVSQSQPSQPQQAQGSQNIQPTPLPPDVDPNDLALPTWVPKPARPAAANNAKTATNANKPTHPGTAGEQGVGETPIVGEVTKEAGGGFKYVSVVNEVTLSATVLDAKRHLVTNLDKTNFVVYEDGQPQNITSFIRKDIPVSIEIGRAHV